MNYLDPENWDDLDGLESRYEVLTQELVTELHERLRPYFLRRVKSEVMQDLPRKVRYCGRFIVHQM
jgi:SNF2 family DNA or RNA helicase